MTFPVSYWEVEAGYEPVSIKLSGSPPNICKAPAQVKTFNPGQIPNSFDMLTAKTPQVPNSAAISTDPGSTTLSTICSSILSFVLTVNFVGQRQLAVTKVQILENETE